jgi:transposase
MGRSIGVDLHRNNFVTATRAENGRTYLRTWKMEDIGRFADQLRPDDRVAVEMTTNTRLFYDAVSPAVAEVQVVNTAQFKVITRSVKKTDHHDAATLALYLEKDMLPTVRLKEVEQGQLAGLVSTRDTLVKQRTTMKNKINNRFAMYGRSIKREMLSSEKGLAAVEAEPFDALVRIEIGVLVAQIRALNISIRELDKTIEASAEKLKGYQTLNSIKGVGTASAAILLTVIGDVDDFANAGKLAAYLGLVPRVSNSNETERSGRITKRGSKLARTALVQCGLVAKKYSSYLDAFHSRVKQKKGGGKANVALARKLLEIIYRALKNDWVFEDFGRFRLQGGICPVKGKIKQRRAG